MPPRYRKRRPKRSTRKPRAKRSRTIDSKVNAIQAFKRTTVAELTTSSGQYGSAGSYSISVMPNVAELSALFDNYRIVKVVLRIVHRSTSLSSIETNNNNLVGFPIIYYVSDLDDATAPTTASEILEYNKHKMFMFTPDKRVLKITVRPRFSNEVFRTGVSTAYAIGAKNTWLDMAYTNIEHYGLKWFIDIPQGGGTTVNASFDVHSTYYVECKDAK